MPYEERFTALSHPLRQHILRELGGSPASVGDLTARVSASQPVVSQHLKVLREAGLVSVRPDGMRRIYQVEPDVLAELRSFLEQAWLTAIQQAGDPHDDNA